MSHDFNNGEKIVYATRLHWIIFFWAALFLLLTIIFITSQEEVFRETWGLPFTFTCLAGLRAFFKRVCSKFIITDQRIILKTGLLRRHCVDLYLNSINGVQVKQGLLGSFLGYGTVVVASHGARESFSKISKPLEFREKVREAKGGGR